MMLHYVLNCRAGMTQKRFICFYLVPKFPQIIYNCIYHNFNCHKSEQHHSGRVEGHLTFRYITFYNRIRLTQTLLILTRWEVSAKFRLFAYRKSHYGPRAMITEGDFSSIQHLRIRKAQCQHLLLS